MSAWVRDSHGKLSSFVTQIWLLLFARLCENLACLTGEHQFERCLCLISIWRSNSEPFSLDNSGKRVREDVSFEESESTPPTKVERKKSPDKKSSGRLPLIGLNSYNEIFEGLATNKRREMCNTEKREHLHERNDLQFTQQDR